MTRDARYYEGFSAGRTAARGEQRTGQDGRPYWLDVPCPTWCVAPHQDNDHYDDRSHYSADEKVSLRLEKMDDGEATEVTAELWQHYREREPRVHISKNGLLGVYLSLAEIDDAIAGLQRLTEHARAESTQRQASLRPVA